MVDVPSTGKKEIARYAVPLGANEATLVITGEFLSSADFEALKKYVDLFKEQHERKAKSMEREPAS